MDIEGIRILCNALPHVTEDIKWGNDLCFMIAKKMFCVASLIAPLMVSFKVTDEEFDELSNKPGIIPAPYVARYKWVLIENISVLTKKQWEHYLTQSYNLVKAKLPGKVLRELSS
jgi:predicted DNA-binding protein (MmcQ/YjbR family)